MFSVLFFLLRRGLSPLRSSFLEMNEALPRTSSVSLELACVDGMKLGKPVGQGQSFNLHKLWGREGISSLSKDFDQKSWGAYHELRKMSLPSRQASQMIELNFMKTQKHPPECLRITVFKVGSHRCIFLICFRIILKNTLALQKNLLHIKALLFVYKKAFLCWKKKKS